MNISVWPRFFTTFDNRPEEQNETAGGAHLMLKALRNKKTAKKIWIVLATLIVPAFVLWGSGSLIRSKQEETYAGRIFGRKISLLEYKDAMDAEKTAAIMQFGDKFSEVEQHLNLESQAWERLLLLYEAKRRKITVSDKEVVELLQRLPFFQRDGKFDNRTYTEIVQYVLHTQPRIFEEQTRQNTILSKLYNQVTNDITVSDEEIKKEYERLNEELSVYYITSIPSDFAKDVSASDEKIRDYFTENPLSFKQPVSFNMDYIVVESEDEIKQVVSQLNKKKDLQKIALDMGIMVKETGLFAQTDPIPGIGWSQGILNLISKLKVGESTPPVHMDKNYYVLQLKERKEAYIPEFEKIKDKTKEMYVKDESTKIAKKKVEECLKKLKDLYQQNPKLADFNKVAKGCGLKTDSTGNFKYGSYIENIGASDKLWQMGKDLKEDEFSDVISMPSGFFIIKVKEKTPIDEKKFESEKAEFSQKLLSLKKQKNFAKFVDELKRKAL